MLFSMYMILQHILANWMNDCHANWHIFSCDQAALRTHLSVRLSVRPSVCHTFFHCVPVIVSSQNVQELLPMTEVMSMQKVKVKGQCHIGHNPT